MATGAQTWSTSAASNNSADGSVNWAEGMAPSAVNNSARAEMASAAMFIKDNSGILLTTGTTAAYTLTSKQVSTAVVDGYTIAATFHATNDASATLNVDGVGAKQIQLIPGTNLSGGEILAGSCHRLHYSSSSTAWVVQGANLLGASAVSSSQIADGSVAYSKIQVESAQTILGNGGSTAASPSELSPGVGISLASTSISAPAFPPTAAFKNLQIKTATTTTINGVADFVTLATSGSTSFITIPCSGTINMASTGVANGIDTGSLTYNTFYAIYAIAASATSTHADLLASTSFTTPLMPSGYAVKARIGAQVTTTTTGTAALHGVYQYGRRAQYVPGVAGTTIPPLITNDVQSSTYSVTSPTLVAKTVVGNGFVVPSTAGWIHIVASTSYGAATGGSVLVAPSTGYSGSNRGPAGSASNIFPIWLSFASNVGANQTAWMLLEGSAIGYAGTAGGSAICCMGWEDNI